MKKIVSTVLAAALALAGISASGQNKMAIEAGFGLSSTKFDYTLGHATANLMGATIGLSYEMPLGETGLGFAPGIQFGYFTKGNVNIYITDKVKAQFDESYLAVPLDINLRLPVGEGVNALIFAGPTFDLGLSSDIKETATKAKYDFYGGALKNVLKYNRFDALIGGGLGFEVEDMVRISVRYDYGLVNRNSGATSRLLKIHRSQLKVGVAYLF